MRNIATEFISHLMLVTQVVSPVAGLVATVSLPASAQAENPAPYHIQLDTATASAVEIKVAPAPNFDQEVLVPLQAAQAEQARLAADTARKAKRKQIAAKPTVSVVAVGNVSEALHQIALCESGSIYTRNSGNGYYGAYQYNLSTWANFGGFARPDLAPADVQDAKATSDVARRGYSPWASCARKLGLI